MTLSIDNLPNNINELKHLVIALVQENQALLEELNVRRRKMFGRSAEPHPPQGEVFNAPFPLETQQNRGGLCRL